MSTGAGRFGADPRVRASLEQRNTYVSSLWRADPRDRTRADPALLGRRALIVDAEDTFTAMIDHQLQAIGMSVTVRRFDESPAFDGYDLVLMGPGPGDPRATDHPKVSRLRASLATLLAERRPFIAVCLSHQVLSLLLGFRMTRLAVQNQGVQKEIDLFGRRERVGFYNTFTALSDEDQVDCAGVGAVEVSRDVETGEVHALRGPRFASMQFHAESLLTQNGLRIVNARVVEALTRQ